MEPTDFQTLDPRVRTLWLLGQAVPFGVAGLIGAGVLVATDLPLLGLACGVVGIAAMLVMALLVAARYRRWQWSARRHSLELRHGVVRRTESSVPFPRLQQIDIVQGPLERWLGIASLVVRTAAATSDSRIPGIPLEAAERVRASLLERAGNDDAV